LLRSWNQLSNFIYLKVVQLFLQGNNPIGVFKSLFHTKRFQRGNKRVKYTKNWQSWASCLLMLLSLTTKCAHTETTPGMLVGTRKRHYRVYTSSNGARERLVGKTHDHRKVRKRTD
jgi:hypothetical protein